MPSSITITPYKIIFHPVAIKINNHIAIAMKTGKGNQGILYGKSVVAFLRSSYYPIACPINCIRIRMASIALITSPNLNNKLNTKAILPNTNSDMYGKCLVG